MKNSAIFLYCFLIACQLHGQKHLPLRDSIPKLVKLTHQLIENETARLKQLEYDRGEWLRKLPQESGKSYKKWKKQDESIHKQIAQSNWKIDQARALLTETLQLTYKSDDKLKDEWPQWKKSYESIKNKSELPNKGKSKTAEVSFPGVVSDEVYDFQVNSPCRLDVNTEKKLISNTYRSLFTYTDPQISTFFKEKDFLQCYTRFFKTASKHIFLELKFVFTSPRAAAIYGNIDYASPAKISFINGDFIYINNYASSKAILEPGTGNTVYLIQFKLDKEDLKYLKNKQADLISFIWTAGMEDYEIYELDIFKEMLSCLNQKN